VGEKGDRPPLGSCPSWDRTRTLLIPSHFGFRRRSPASVRGLDCAFTCATTRSGGSHPVSTPSPVGAWLGVASEGSADFESIHTRRFRRGVQRVHRDVLPESGVLPITPRGNNCRLSNECGRPSGSEILLGAPSPCNGVPRLSILPCLGHAHGFLAGVALIERVEPVGVVRPSRPTIPRQTGSMARRGDTWVRRCFTLSCRGVWCRKAAPKCRKNALAMTAWGMSYVPPVSSGGVTLFEYLDLDPTVSLRTNA